MRRISRETRLPRWPGPRGRSRDQLVLEGSVAAVPRTSEPVTVAAQRRFSTGTSTPTEVNSESALRVACQGYDRDVAATRASEPSSSGWDVAVDLANWVATGRELPQLSSPVLLDAGELLHADLQACGWRYHAVDVTYEAPHAFAIGGPLLFGLVATGSAVARRGARRAAVALAAPQWRALGAIRILTTDRRLLVWHENAWASVWYGAIREFRPDLESRRLDLTFDNDPPYCLAGPWVPYLTVILTTVLARGRGVAAVDDALRVPVSN